MRRRDVIGLLAAAAAWPCAARGQGANYPGRLIRLMHGFPPGGNVDVVARLMAQEMAKGLRQTIVVEGKPGNAGNLAAEAVAGAAPDGYTLLLVAGLHPAVAATYHNLKYDPLNSFTWISTVSFYPFVLCVRRDAPFKTLADLIAAAGAKPGSVTSGTAGNGSISHMTTELIGSIAKVKFLDVPYRGEAPALTGLLGGEVDLMIATSTAALPHLKSGALRGIGVTGKMQWKDFADIPTVAEQGLPDFEVISWSGLAAPAKVAQPIIARLHAEIERVLKVPGVRTRLESFGAEVRSTTPQEMRALVARQIALWTKVATEANIRLD